MKRKKQQEDKNPKNSQKKSEDQQDTKKKAGMNQVRKTLALQMIKVIMCNGKQYL